MQKRLRLVVAFLIFLLFMGCQKQSEYSHGTKGEYEKVNVDGDISFSYQLYTPVTETSEPLVIVFHGFGETENVLNCKIPQGLSDEKNQNSHPCYILVPQIEDSVYLDAEKRDALYKEIMDEVDAMVQAGKIDDERILVMGNSFGGLGTVEFTERYPDVVAKAIVMCPALNYSKDAAADIGLMKDVPVWFVHAENDNVIPASISEEAVSRLKTLGAKKVYFSKLTDEEMKAVGVSYGYHNADFAVMADEKYLEWLFN